MSPVTWGGPEPNEQKRRVKHFGRLTADGMELRTRCSWCDRWMSGEPKGEYVESHGICETCSEKMLEGIR